ncbi:MAG: family 20 glycosylhydrolase [Acidobacteriota bacterium]|nr:family 20 glycosylhydrolase [Acidobacteriota bacterium]
MPRPDDPVARLLPSPRRVERLPGFLQLDRGFQLVLDSGSPAERRAAAFLAGRLGERASLDLAVTAAPATPFGNVVLAETDADPESFELRVDAAGARLQGDPAGLRYGAEALAQLAGPDGRVPAVHLRDAPALRRRGFLLDISRGKVPRPETIRRLLELLARLRYNELFLYTEHTFQFERHPEIGAGSGGYSAAEIRELDAWARECGVELVPCLQTFGHFRRILEKTPYRRLAESERLWSVSPEAPGTYPLLRDMLGEYLPNFASAWAHLNCDEPVDLGKGLSNERAGREGPAAVFAGHVNRVAGMARELGKRPMIWADVIADHPEALDLLDSSITLADWWYEPDHDFDRVRRFRDAGRDFLTVAGTSSWTSLFPRFDTSLPNIRGHARAAKRFGASGFILTDWGDGGHYNLFGGSLFPIAAGAEAAWGDEDRPEEELAAAFSEHVAADPSGFAGEFATRLGRLHDTGFPHFNHSPLKTVFFETRLRRGARVPARGALEATLEALRRLAAETEARGLPPGLAGAEWRFALDASLLAAERGLATLRLRQSERSGSPDDRRLAGELAALAGRQGELARRFRELWLRANRPEGIEMAQKRFRDAARALRRAARSLASS